MSALSSYAQNERLIRGECDRLFDMISKSTRNIEKFYQMVGSLPFFDTDYLLDKFPKEYWHYIHHLDHHHHVQKVMPTVRENRLREWFSSLPCLTIDLVKAHPKLCDYIIIMTSDNQVPLRYIYEKMDEDLFHETLDENEIGCLVSLDDRDILDTNVIMGCKSITWQHVLDHKDSLTTSHFNVFARDNPNMTMDIFVQYNNLFSCEVMDIVITGKLTFDDVRKYGKDYPDLQYFFVSDQDFLPSTEDDLIWMIENDRDCYFDLDDVPITLSYDSYTKLSNKREGAYYLAIDDQIKKVGKICAYDPKFIRPSHRLTRLLDNRNKLMSKMVKQVVNRWLFYCSRPDAKGMDTLIQKVKDIYTQ